MSFGILLLSIVFAGIETLVSWMMLSFSPVAKSFSAVPLVLITAIVFGLGMLLSYVLIFLIGGSGITDKAADFVRDHFGRALVLMLASVVLVFALATGGEAAYQAGPIQGQKRVGDGADICFVLDYSSSMRNDGRIDSLRAAFADAIEDMDDGQRICIVGYDDEGYVLYDWHAISNVTRREVLEIVNDTDATVGYTNYHAGFEVANGLIEQAVEEGHNVAVIMISDGEYSYWESNSMQMVAPAILENEIPVFTIGFGDEAEFDTLKVIAAETGGEFLQTGNDVESATQGLVNATQSASASNASAGVADTLLTARLPSHESFINPAVLRILILLVISFVFKLIVNVCIGNNDSHFGVHVLTALVVAIIGALVVEFGYRFGLPMFVVEAIYWLLLMVQIVFTNRNSAQGSSDYGD